MLDNFSYVNYYVNKELSFWAYSLEIFDQKNPQSNNEDNVFSKYIKILEMKILRE